MKRVLFFGGIIPENHKQDIEQAFGYAPQDPSDTLQRNILRGIHENTGENITLFNSYFLPNIKEVYHVSSFEEDMDFGKIINVPFRQQKLICHFSKCINIIKTVKKKLSANKDGEKTGLIIYSAYFPFLIAADRLKKKFNLDICLVIPDLPQYMGLDSSRSLYKKLSAKASLALFNRYNRCVDRYVLLTKQMNDVVNKSGKPYTVVEGIAAGDYEQCETIVNDDKKTILYSGTMQYKYGIGTLLKAINYIENKNVQFMFCGMGEASKEIKEIAQTDSRVTYFKQLNRLDLYKQQQNSSILVNPRQNINEFTKYSFPSKNIEYLLSGRPVVAYKLDGIADEYDNYLVYPKNNEPEELAETLKKVLEDEEGYYTNRAKLAREFVLKNKNYIEQTGKILDLFRIQRGE